MKATIQFETGSVSYSNRKGLWTLTREFENLRHLDNFIDYICRTRGYYLDELYYQDYPFREGDTYYTVEENGDQYEVVKSCWDDVSEEIYDENPHGYMTWSFKKAKDYAEQLNKGLIKIYR